MSAHAALPDKIYQSARLGELQKVIKWVIKGGRVDALCPTTTESGELALCCTPPHSQWPAPGAVVRELC